MLQLEISSHTDVTTALVMCDSCCTYSWVSAGLAQRLNLTGQKLDILVNGFNSTESVPTQQVEVNVFAKFDHHEYSFRVTPFVKDSLSVGSKTIDVTILQDRFAHLQPIKPIVYNYSDVEMILGQPSLSNTSKDEIKTLLSLPYAHWLGSQWPTSITNWCSSHHFQVQC